MFLLLPNHDTIACFWLTCGMFRVFIENSSTFSQPFVFLVQLFWESVTGIKFKICTILNWKNESSYDHILFYLHFTKPPKFVGIGFVFITACMLIWSECGNGYNVAAVTKSSCGAVRMTRLIGSTKNDNPACLPRRHFCHTFEQDKTKCSKLNIKSYFISSVSFKWMVQQKLQVWMGYLSHGWHYLCSSSCWLISSHWMWPIPGCLDIFRVV